MQIKTGHYSFFQTNYGFQQSGRIINACYGPLFAYFNGALLLLCGNWFTFQIISIYLLCLLAAGNMMHLLRYSGVSKIASLLLSLVYINIGMIPAFINASSFSGWGQAFMPLVLLNGVRMVKDQEKPIDWVILGATMGLLLQVHLLSALLACVLLAPFFLLALFKKRNVWKDFFKAVALASALGLNTIVAVFWLAASNKMAHLDAYNMAVSGLKLGSYQNDLGSSYGQLMPMFLAIILLNFLYIFFNRAAKSVEKLLAIWSLVLMLIASNRFPWGYVQNKWPVLASNFQFPFRLVVIIYPMVILSFGLSIQKLAAKGGKPFLLLLSLALLLDTAVPVAESHRKNTFHANGTPEMAQVVGKGLKPLISVMSYGNQPDYLPVVGKEDNLGHKYHMLVIKRWKKFDHQVMTGGRLKLSWTSTGGKITLPLVAYSQTELTLNGRKIHNLKRKSGGFPVVRARMGKNTVIMTFKQPLWCSLLINLCWFSWLLLLLLLFKKALDPGAKSCYFYKNATAK
ncbi:hypothetical protein [Lactobacillus sp.]|uniref:hypothetical protein n=1 Tax=Lactobacillus sp. TaxID=1591 RepID=UPI003F10522A